jgi:hypothetical protein
MFGLWKKPHIKLAEMSLEYVRNLIAALSQQRKLPLQVWADPLLLGYLNGCVVQMALKIPSHHFTGEELREASRIVFEKVNPSQAQRMFDATETHIQQRSEDFDAGVELAKVGLAVYLGEATFDTDPEVIRAKAHASRNEPELTGEEYDKAVMDYLLLFALALPIAKRFGFKWKIAVAEGE